MTKGTQTHRQTPTLKLQPINRICGWKIAAPENTGSSGSVSTNVWSENGLREKRGIDDRGLDRKHVGATCLCRMCRPNCVRQLAPKKQQVYFLCGKCFWGKSLYSLDKTPFSQGNRFFSVCGRKSELYSSCLPTVMHPIFLPFLSN